MVHNILTFRSRNTL